MDPPLPYELLALNGKNKQKQLQKKTGFPTQRNPLFLVVPEHNTRSVH